jgi:Na+/melibiose symporter-like transporter
VKDRAFGTADYFKITILAFAITALWQSLHTVILPLRVLDFVDESQKNTYLGLLTFAGLLLAMAFQPIISTISDCSQLAWGRRRPYILLGAITAVLLLSGIGLAGSYAVLFASYCLLQLASNTAQGPFQAFIPELVPEGKRGRASGVKGLLETLGGVALIYPVAVFMDSYASGQGRQWLWLSLAILGSLLLVAMAATMLMVKEPHCPGAPRVSVLPAILRTFKIDVRTNRGFLWFLLSRLLVFMAFTIIQQFSLYFLRDVIHVTDPAEAAARFLIVAVVGMLVVVYFAGRLSDRVGRKPINIASAVLSAAGILIIILSQTYGSILVAAGILGVAIGAFSSTNWALATDLVARGEEARYLALANVATAGGAAIARLIGPVIDFFESQRAGLGYQVMLMVCLAFFVLGGLLLLKVKPPINGAAPPSPRHQPAPE